MNRTRVKVVFSSAFVLACLLALTVIATAVVAPAPPESTTSTAPANNTTQAAPAPHQPAVPATTTLEQATTHAAAMAGPSVVKIESAAGLGSGVIIDKRGYLVTNYHVLGGARGEVAPEGRYTVTLANGTSYRATIAGTDAPDDLAVLKINAPPPPLRPLPLANSDALKVGQFVLAVGNPLGYSQTVTFGIVSTLRRTVAENGPATFIPDMIQTSAPINPGNSGGALVDLQGRLVGVPTLAATDPRLGTAAQGIGFAISSNRVSFIAQQIIKESKVAHSGRPYLGVRDIREVTPFVAAQYGLAVENGVLIGGVEPRGPADRAGLRAGNVIVRLAGRPTASEAAFGDVLARLKPGEHVSVTVVGQGGQRTVTAILGELPVR